jgi:hypothetical protein
VHDLGRRQYRRVGAFENTAAKIQTENERLKRLSAHHGTTTTTYAATATRDTVCVHVIKLKRTTVPHRAVLPSRVNYPISIFSYRCLDRDRRSTWPDRDPHAGGADSKPRILSTQLAGAGGAQPRAPVIKINTLGTVRVHVLYEYEIRNFARRYLRTKVLSYKVQLRTFVRK